MDRNDHAIDGDDYVVTIVDTINQALAPGPPLTYTSPPQPYRQALTLATALLGHQPPAGTDSRGVCTWYSATAGGRRVVTLAGQPPNQRAAADKPSAPCAPIAQPGATDARRSTRSGATREP
jgi:hypothetical protein